MKIYSIHNLVPHIIIKWSSHLLAKILYGYSSNPEKYSISKFNPNSTNFEEHTYDYSNLPLKYASWLKCTIFLTKIRVHTLLFEHVMQSHLPQIHEFFMLDIQCHFVNVSMKHLKWLLKFTIHLSNFCLNIRTKQLVIDVEDGVV